MTTRRWLPTFAPVTTITIAAIFASGLAVAAVMFALSGPWLGVVFDRAYADAGVRVERVSAKGPAAGKLNSGDIVEALLTPSHGRVEILPVATLEDPDSLASYAEYNAFFAHQRVLWKAISSASFSALLSDGREIELTPAVFPGPSVLPPPFWWLLFFGGISFLIGVSVWSLRRSETVTRLLAISGLGFMLGSYSCAIYIARELALPGDIFFALASANHLGIMLFAYAAIFFFYYFPQKLGNDTAAKGFVLTVVFLWLNEMLQLWSWPVHAFYAHFVPAYALLLLFATLQWKKSRTAPEERAMLKWLLTTVVLSLGITFALFYIPVIFTGKPIASTVLTFGTIFAFFMVLVTGIVRYHQFDMEYWWQTAGHWLIFILIAVLSDVLFVYFLRLSNTESAGLSIGAGGIYLMLRQWFWRRYLAKDDGALDRALPHLLEILVQQKSNSLPELQWRQVLERVFDPLAIKVLTETRAGISIERGGLALQLPMLDGLASIEVLGYHHGKRLFAASDAKLATRLLELMRHTQDLVKAREEGAREERHRIQRDLHDDVAARLLSLLHQSHEPVIRGVARNALRGLRDVIHLLGSEEVLLEDVLIDLEAGSREQLAGLNVHLHWSSPDQLPGVMLDSKQHINLLRIVREAIANALKHAHAENIRVVLECENEKLLLRIGNDGAVSDPSGWSPGRGVSNIKYRVAEMGGSHEWGIEQEAGSGRYCYLAVSIPLPLSGKLEKHTADRGL